MRGSSFGGVTILYGFCLGHGKDGEFLLPVWRTTLPDKLFSYGWAKRSTDPVCFYGQAWKSIKLFRAEAARFRGWFARLIVVLNYVTGWQQPRYANHLGHET